MVGVLGSSNEANPLLAYMPLLGLGFLLASATLWARLRDPLYGLATAYWLGLLLFPVVHVAVGTSLPAREAMCLAGALPGLLFAAFLRRLVGFEASSKPDWQAVAAGALGTLLLDVLPVRPEVQILPAALAQVFPMTRVSVQALLAYRSRLGFTAGLVAVVSLAFALHMGVTPLLFQGPEIHAASWALAFGLAFLQMTLVLAALVERSARSAALLEFELRAARTLGGTARLVTLGQLAAALGHEVATPLASLKLWVEVSRRLTAAPEPDAAELRRVLQHMEQNVEHLSALVRSIGSNARDGTRDPFAPVPIGRLVEDAVDLVRMRVHATGLVLRVSVACPEAPLECRAVQVTQILSNLLLNACDAVEGCDSPWIELSAGDDGDAVVFRIRDGGPGIPAALRSEIFRPLFTTKPPDRGTGLGLGISRGIAAEHRGRLELLEGTPTCFELRLPWRRPDAAPDARPERSADRASDEHEPTRAA